MALPLPPIPNSEVSDITVWRDWFFRVSQILVLEAAIAWKSIDFTGSNLTDIQTRNHNDLQNIQGSTPNEYYHIDSNQDTILAPLDGLTGYVYANSLSPLTASTTIPWSDITGAPSITEPSYGSFSNNADQLTSADNTPTTIVLNTTDMAHNMSLSSNQITINTTGKFNLQFSIQFANNHSQAHNAWIWLKKNGSDLAGTGSKYDVPSTHGSSDGYLIAVANFYLDVIAGDVFEVVFAASRAYIPSPLQDGVYIEAYAASTSPFTMPAVPSSIVTINQIA